ncbi:MAG TPA: response regulator, partial [Acidimicrobiales bacterium]|nr:response regulator [Acidimicrobiales bacterium]
MSATPRILVVDDEPYITDLLGAALRFEGFDVETAATGTEALTVAEQGRHDLVLLDVMLPDVNGTEVCRRLRAQGLRTPVLFL